MPGVGSGLGAGGETAFPRRCLSGGRKSRPGWTKHQDVLSQTAIESAVSSCRFTPRFSILAKVRLTELLAAGRCHPVNLIGPAWGARQLRRAARLLEAYGPDAAPPA